jgi:branched-chain amino acid aminotransferase
MAKDDGLEVIERSVDLTELYIADEVFACGTSSYIAPVIEVDARRIGDGKPGPLTKKIRDQHHRILHSQDSNRQNWLTVIS